MVAATNSRSDLQFKDYFSQDSNAYQVYRPNYPKSLFDYLSSLVVENNLAWDCATGTGQAAVALSNYFSNVVATDASSEQINNAVLATNIDYQVGRAEQSDFEECSVDLITVAQSIHWFDLKAFYTEVNRVLKPNGVLAIWTYNLLKVSPEIDAIVNQIYYDELGDFWPKERQIIENNCKDIDFPMHSINAPKIEMQANWNFEQFLGYLNTWSALKLKQKSTHKNVIFDYQPQLQKVWQDCDDKKTISWPLTLKVWQKI